MRFAACGWALAAALFICGRSADAQVGQVAPLSGRDSRPIDPAGARRLPDDARVFYDVLALGLEGRGWPQASVEAPFDRLPATAREQVRPDVWRLSRQAAGLCVRFETDATDIAARWELLLPAIFRLHMPATAASGLDLYVRASDGGWRWLGAGVPHQQVMLADLARGLDPGRREYLLYLPLYNGVASLELGLPEGARLWRAPDWPAERRPLVFYGTSLTQGASASRPGMAAPAIVGRRLARPIVNLGFAGNGTLEVELARLMGTIDAAAYVVDCLPNLTGEQVAARIVPFVAALRAARPTTPVLLVEDRTYAFAHLRAAERERTAASRAALRSGFERLRAAGDSQLHYLAGDDLLGDDGEATVDGVHPSDVGMLRMAHAFGDALAPLLE